jgi:hypothetical protein
MTTRVAVVPPSPCLNRAVLLANRGSKEGLIKHLTPRNGSMLGARDSNGHWLLCHCLRGGAVVSL